MKSILVIAERELKTYFVSPIAYVVLTIFTFLSGFVFYFFVRAMVNSVASRAMMSAQTGRPPDPIDMVVVGQDLTQAEQKFYLDPTGPSDELDDLNLLGLTP